MYSAGVRAPPVPDVPIRALRKDPVPISGVVAIGKASVERRSHGHSYGPQLQTYWLTSVVRRNGRTPSAPDPQSCYFNAEVLPAALAAAGCADLARVDLATLAAFAALADFTAVAADLLASFAVLAAADAFVFATFADVVAAVASACALTSRF